MIQLNGCVDSRATGGTHSGARRSKPKLTFTANTKQDANIILQAVAKSVRSGLTDKQKLADVEWVVGQMGQLSLMDSVEQSIGNTMKGRKRKSKKSRTNPDVQRLENPGKFM